MATIRSYGTNEYCKYGVENDACVDDIQCGALLLAPQCDLIIKRVYIFGIHTLPAYITSLLSSSTGRLTDHWASPSTFNARPLHPNGVGTTNKRSHASHLSHKHTPVDALHKVCICVHYYIASIAE